MADIVLRVVPTLWLGMVLAISFLETPLKFRAPEITLERGLGIGRIVFHALNVVEAVLAAGVVAALVVGSDIGGRPGVEWSVGISVGALVVQVAALRPVLDRRLTRRLAGESMQRSAHHLVYIGLEVAKVAALSTAAICAART